MSIDVTVVIPTFNENSNLRHLVESLSAVMKEYRWELVFVDDNSTDGSGETLLELAGLLYSNVRRIRRIGRRGLSSACIEGMLSSAARYLVVMDADGQHDERILPRMLAMLIQDEADLVVGSRYVLGGSYGDMPENRAKMSRFAVRMSQLMSSTCLSDPMSGYFALRRDMFESFAENLSGVGYKILLDIVSSTQTDIRIAEVPYRMRARERGESKLDMLIMLEFFELLLDKKLGRWIPLKFLQFSSVGLLGVAVHLSVLYLMYAVLEFVFTLSQAIATLVAMLHNFLLNNLVTYRDQRLRGWNFWQGMMSFVVACSLGAFINVIIATTANDMGMVWWISGTLGAFVAAVWNYAVTATLSWKSVAK